MDSMSCCCQWSRGSSIGRGSSATVSLATAHPSGALFAVKSVELSNSHNLQREKTIHSLLQCPQILTYMGSDITTENGRHFFNIFTEFMPGGTLSDSICRQGGRLDEPTVRAHTRAILEGLCYLHSKRLVHCDIKGRNVLIGPHGAKIADLGCARWVDFDGCDSSRPPISGTPLFMAPEVARGEQQGFESDIWSLGCTIIEMVTGRPPWLESGDPFSVLYRIGCTDDLPEFPELLSEQGKDFLGKCLRREPEERWTAAHLLQHPFVDPRSSASHCKQLSSESLFSSPKSTLDQSLWDSLGAEVTATTALGAGSPAQRIRKLSAGAARQIPNWTREENWVTVRSSPFEDFSLGEPSNLVAVDESAGGPFSSEEIVLVSEPELVLDSSAIREDHVPLHSFVNGGSVEVGGSNPQPSCGGGGTDTLDVCSGDVNFRSKLYKRKSKQVLRFLRLTSSIAFHFVVFPFVLVCWHLSLSTSCNLVPIRSKQNVYSYLCHNARKSDLGFAGCPLAVVYLQGAGFW